MNTAIRIAAGALSAACCVWGALPLIASRMHVGCAAMIGVGAVGLAVSIWWRQTVSLWQAIWSTAVGKTALSSLTVLAVALVLLFIGVSVTMVAAACRPAPDDATLVVLGAGLRGDRPSRTLRERLDAAYAYLIEHPDAACILTGGQGADEPCTEASAMKTYLLNKGIDESRLYLEERSTSTDENFAFSKQVAQDNGLSLSVAVVTQEFHQCRAQILARKHGFTEVGAVTAHTIWDLLPSYWIRDFAGLCHWAFLGS